MSYPSLFHGVFILFHLQWLKLLVEVASQLISKRPESPITLQHCLISLADCFWVCFTVLPLPVSLKCQRRIVFANDWTKKRELFTCTLLIFSICWINLGWIYYWKLDGDNLYSYLHEIELEYVMTINDI